MLVPAKQSQLPLSKSAELLQMYCLGKLGGTVMQRAGKSGLNRYTSSTNLLCHILDGTISEGRLQASGWHTVTQVVVVFQRPVFDQCIGFSLHLPATATTL